MSYLLPVIGSKGVFEFLPPFDSPALGYNNKEYEVVEIRMIKAIYDAGEDPQNNIYLAHDIQADEFLEDLKNNVPIVTLTYDDVNYLYVPANRLKIIPNIIGKPATERILSFSLGLVPDDINLLPLYENIATIIEDTLSIKPEVRELPGSATILISEEKYQQYKTMMGSKARSYNKSFRYMYYELLNRTENLKKALEEINPEILTRLGYAFNQG